MQPMLIDYTIIKTPTFAVVASIKELTCLETFRLSALNAMFFPCQNAYLPFRRSLSAAIGNNKTSSPPSRDICTCRIKHKSTHKSLNVIILMPHSEHTCLQFAKQSFVSIIRHSSSAPGCIPISVTSSGNMRSAFVNHCGSVV